MFFLTILSTSTSSLNNLLKMIYHEPRPYMDFSTIKNTSCSPDYGKPSGHTMGTLIFYFTFFYLIFYEKIKTFGLRI